MKNFNDIKEKFKCLDQDVRVLTRDASNMENIKLDIKKYTRDSELME